MLRNYIIHIGGLALGMAGCQALLLYGPHSLAMRPETHRVRVTGVPDDEQVRLFAILAIGILLIACINFMNLSTARWQKRAREAGIRKTIGPSRKDLVRQFFLEAFFFSIIASVLALVLLRAGLPFLNRLLDTDLRIPYTSRAFWTGFAALIFLTGLLAGSYPSLYLSSFNPGTVLKGMARAGKGALRFRQTLVV